MDTITKIEKLFKAHKYSDALFNLLTLTDDEIQQLDNEISIVSIFFNYFSYQKEILDLEKKLLSKFPNQFIQGVRTSQSFLKPKRLDNLLSYSFSDLDIHKQVWLKLSEQEKIFWDEIETNLAKILKLNINDVLVDVIFWLENFRYKKDNSKAILDLSSIYNFFIQLYLSKTKQKENVSKKEFEETFFKKLSEKIKTPELNKPISELLVSIQKWINFNHITLEPYCFDLNIEVEEKNGIVYFNQSPVNHYNWKLDGIRYEKNRLDYFFKAQKVVSDEIKNKKRIIRGENDDTISLNVSGAIRLKKNELILKDLALLDIDFFGEQQGFFKAFSTVSGYSLNRMYRYELVLDEFKKASKNYYEAYAKTIHHSFRKGIDVLPFLLTSKKDFIDKIKNVFKHFNEKLISNAFSSFCFDVKPNFDRFNINYDVSVKPFVKISDWFFCPMLFFANNDWFYASAQTAIKNTNKNKELRRVSAEKMEQLLTEKFKEKGFTVKWLSNKEASQINGDADIIVEDDSTTLLIQLKRTYLRINLKDAFYETMKSDDKASKQLNKAEAFFKSKNDIYNLKREVKKWIVSTSYEFINIDIADCNKINYFDLLFALENPELNSLNNIIDYLESNKNLLSFYNKEQEENLCLINQIGLPLQLDEPKVYTQPIFRTKNDNDNYNELYNKALSFYGKRDEKAIKILQQCLLLNPTDIDVYGTLGNCYANIRDLENLINSFDRALKIIPNEPYIKRNYASALIENKAYFKGLLLLMELYVDYPLVGDIFLIFATRLNHYKEYLSENEHNLLNDKWNELTR